MTLQHLGFTGTRHGVTRVQEDVIWQLMSSFRIVHGEFVAHHGDCVGADATFFRLARQLDAVRIVSHPPVWHGLRANVGGDEVREPLNPLLRNAVIVRESGWMIAAPYELVQQVRGGTWSTIRRARAWGRKLIIVFRDGSIEKDGWP